MLSVLSLDVIQLELKKYNHLWFQGFVMAVSQMRTFVPAIYDATVAIPKSSPVPTMLRIFKGQSSVVSQSDSMMFNSGIVFQFECFDGCFVLFVCFPHFSFLKQSFPPLMYSFLLDMVHWNRQWLVFIPKSTPFCFFFFFFNLNFIALEWFYGELMTVQVHVHIKRHMMSELPESDDAIAQWCKDIFVAKVCPPRKLVISPKAFLLYL